MTTKKAIKIEGVTISWGGTDIVIHAPHGMGGLQYTEFLARNRHTIRAFKKIHQQPKQSNVPGTIKSV